MVISMKSSLLLLWGVFCVFPLAALSNTTPENKVPATGNHDDMTTQQQLIGANVQTETQTHPTQNPARAGAAATEETEKAAATLSGSADKTSALTAAATAKPPHGTNTSKSGDHQQSSTYRAAPSEASTTAAPRATKAPTANPASTTKPEKTLNLHPTNTSDDSVESTVSTLSQATPSGPSSTPKAADTTSGGVPAMPGNRSQPVSTPMPSIFTTAKSTIAASATKPPSTISSNTTNSTSPADIVVPDGSKIHPSTMSSNTTNSTSPADIVVPDESKTPPSTMSSNTTNSTSPADIVVPDESKTPPSPISPITTTNSTSPAGIVIPDGANTPPSTKSSNTTTNSTSPSDIVIPDGPKTPPSTRSSNTTTNSTSPALIPGGPKAPPTQPTKSPATTSNRPPSTDPQPCSSRGVVKTCLIAIASLAGLATIFIVTTIILCTKLSRRAYRVRKPREDTEMMCISSLMPERNYTYSRQRNHVSNGVLVMHTAGDSDEEGGDNLTLSSFLPENDRLV